MTDANGPDCYSSVKIEMHKTFFLLITDVNPNATKCNLKIIEDEIQAKIEKIRFSVIISQNEDKSGFNYHNVYDIPDYKLG